MMGHDAGSGTAAGVTDDRRRFGEADDDVRAAAETADNGWCAGDVL